MGGVAYGVTNRRRPLGALLRESGLAESTVLGRVPGATCMEAKEGAEPLPAAADRRASAVGANAPEEGANGESERRAGARRPLLMVDIDGVISLFGALAGEVRGGAVEGSFHSIEGIPHFLSATAAANLLALEPLFELVWASGWEERAGEHLPHLLGLPAAMPFLCFARTVGRSNAHWKLDAIGTYAGARPLAWVDDAFNAACHEWAERRTAPTLLVQTDPERGLTAPETERLAGWARGLPASGQRRGSA